MALKLTTGQARWLIGKAQQPEDAAQSLRNARNRATGQRFEDRLQAYHAGLKEQGIATVYKTNPDIRVTAPGKAIITGKGPCDYFAFLYTGRVVFFDAKSRKDKAFTLDDQHQIDWLRSMGGYGHTAGYLVYWSDYDQVCWHDIAGVEKRVRMIDGAIVDGCRWLDVAGKL